MHDLAGTSRLVVRRSTGRGSAPEMAPLKLKVGIARCIRLKEPSYDIPRSSNWEYRTRYSDESESGESLQLTTMTPSASVPSPTGAGSGWIARRDVGASDGIGHLVGRSKHGRELTSRRWLLLKWVHDSI